MASVSLNIADELDNLDLGNLFNDYKILKTKKGKDAVLYRGYYYNHQRDNAKSTVFKCRHIVDKKECTSTFTLQKDGKFNCKDHTHDPMEPIQSEIMLIMQEIDNIILNNPTISIQNIYNQKEVELVDKYGALLVATYWPEFESKDSAFFAHKNKLVPKLPTSIDDLKDLPDNYKLTTTKQQFLASPIDMFSQFIMLISSIGLNILANSKKWWCDGTFKTSPKFYYQHYIIHGKYQGSWPLPAMYAFMSGKTFELYNNMLTQLKLRASEADLELKPEFISCDFEKGAIKAFKFHFPGVKIQCCHFHFTSAIHKKVVELGLKTAYGGEKATKEFTTWIRMFMSFPFLMLDDIDEVWDEMVESKPDLGDVDGVKVDRFLNYFEDTWIKNNCHFGRELWNIFDQYSSRTNNISETYNHKINSQLLTANSNIYKVLDLVKKEETLTSTKYERVNLGKEKKPTNTQQVKDAKIALLKSQYKHGEVEVMDYLIKISEFCKSYD